MADWLKLFDPTSDSEPAQTPSQPEVPSWLRAFTYEDLASPAPSREMIEPIANYFIDTLSPILGPVVDVLLRGQYGSARAFRGFAPDLFDPEARPTIFERIGGAAKGFWEGAVRGQPDSYQDIIREAAPNWPEWLKTAIGFGADVFLDPTTYIGIGAVGKSGQRSLLSFAGVDLVKGEKVFNTLQDAVNHLKKNTVAGQWLDKHFSTRRGITDDEFWNAYQAARSEAQYLVAKALESNIPLEKAVADIEKNLGIPRSVLTDLIERPVTTGEIIAEHTVKEGETVAQIAKTWKVDPDQIRQLNNLKKGARLKEGQVLKIPTIGEISRLEGYPQEAKNLIEQFQIIQQGRVQREMAEGIPIAPLESDVITYMGHYLTPEAREALEKAGIGKPGHRFSALIDQSVRHPSGQRRQFRDLTVAEINQMAREGEIIPGFKGNIFIEDPVLINVIRDTMHSRTLAAAHFIRNVVDNPEWARPLVTKIDEVAELAGVDQFTKALKEANSGKPFRGGLDWESTGKWYDPDDDFLHKVWVSPRGDAIQVTDHLEDFARAFSRITGIDIDELDNMILGKKAETPEDVARIIDRIAGEQGWVALSGDGLGISAYKPLTKEQWNYIAKELADIRKSGSEWADKPVMFAQENRFTDDPSSILTLKYEEIAGPTANPGTVKRILEERGLVDESNSWTRKTVERQPVDLDVPDVPDVPEGWRKLSASAQERFGPLVEGVVFREDIADALDEYVQKAFDPKAVDELIGLYDRWLNVWKAYTLGTRPRWMINNLMGNLWNGVVLGGATATDLTDAFKALVGGRGNIINHRVQPGETLTSISKQYGVSIDQIVRANNLANPDRIFAGEILVVPKGEATIAGYSAAELINLAERYGAIRKGLYGVEIGYRGGLPQLQGVTSQLQIPVRPLFAANQVIEDWTRLSLFINRIKKGDTPQQAAQYVKKYLFDYTDLTPTEQYVMKRIAPFYTWVRKNIPLQMEHLVTTPGRYSIPPKLMEATESLQEEPYPGVAMPEWMQRSLVLRTGDAGMPGTARFLSLTGHPAADLINLLADIASGEPPRTLLSSNPVIAALFALGGMDIYSGQEIPENRLVSVLPGVTMNARHYTALENLFPPIDTIRSLTVPYANPLISEPDPYRELKMWLLGYKTYDRHIDEDIMNLMEDLYRQQSLLEYQMTRSLLLGRDWEYEAYYKQYEELIDTVMTLTDALSRVPANRAP